MLSGVLPFEGLTMAQFVDDVCKVRPSHGRASVGGYGGVGRRFPGDDPMLLLSRTESAPPPRETHRYAREELRSAVSSISGSLPLHFRRRSAYRQA